MIYEEKTNGLRILKPSDNYHKLRGYNTTYDKDGNEIVDYFDVIYLSKFQDKNDYYEVSVYDIPGYEFPNELSKFQERVDKQEQVIKELQNNSTTLLTIFNEEVNK